MNSLLKFYGRKLSYFLFLLLCVQGSTSELVSTSSSKHQTIESFEAIQKMDQLLLLIQKRLAIMHEVARTKWNQNLPIEDKIREDQVLEKLSALARQYGLDEKWVTKFFQAQIDASKEIQKNDFTLWKKEGVLLFEEVFSLGSELRSYIDHLNQEMMMLLSKIDLKNLNGHVLEQPISTRSLDYVESDVWLLAILPLKTINHR